MLSLCDSINIQTVINMNKGILHEREVSMRDEDICFICLPFFDIAYVWFC